MHSSLLQRTGNVQAKPLVDKPYSSYPFGFWNATDYWQYTFLNSAPQQRFPHVNHVSVYSNRTVKASAICSTPPYHSPDSPGLVTIQETSGRTIDFRTLALGLESIYYLTTPVLSTINSSGECGPGCSSVYVLEVKAGPPASGSFVNQDTSFFYYSCNITVASDSPGDSQTISAFTGAVAAQAIALSGEITSDLSINTAKGHSEYVSYNFGVPFGEPQNNSAAGMASQISRFSIGVISAAAQTNPTVIVQGKQPQQGVHLVLELPVVFYVILFVIVGLQLGLLLLATFFASRVKVPGGHAVI